MHLQDTTDNSTIGKRVKVIIIGPKGARPHARFRIRCVIDPSPLPLPASLRARGFHFW